MGRTDESDEGTALLVLASGNFAQLGTRFLLGALIPLILVEFDATKSSVGLAMTGMWAVYAFLQFPSGVLADRYGERAMLLMGLTGTAAGALLVALSTSLVVFGAFVLLLGAGAGFFYSPASSLVTRVYDQHGRPLAVMTATGAAAGTVYPAAGSVIGVRIGWRSTVALSLVVTLPVLVASVWAVPSLRAANPDRDLRAGLDLDRTRELLARPSVAYSLVLGVLTTFAFQSISSFLPTFLVEYRGLDPGQAGVVFGALFALSAVVQPAVGRLSDRFSRDLAIGTSIGLAVVGFSILLGVGGQAGLFAGTLVLGVGVSWPGPIQARFMDQFDDAERGYGIGLVRTVYMSLGSLGSLVVGTLADASGWLLSYGAVIGLLVACLLLIGTNRVTGRGL